MRPKLATVIRIAIAVGGIGILLYFADLSALTDAVKSTDLRLFGLAVLTLLLIRLLVSTRWWLFIRNSKQDVSWKKITHAIFVSSSLGTFFPTGLSEDVFRVLYLDLSAGSRSQIFASVFLDRLSGMVALGALSLIGITYVVVQGTTLPVEGLAIFGILLLLGPILLPTFARLALSIKRLSEYMSRHKVSAFLVEALIVIGDIRLYSRLAVLTLLLSFLIQLGRCIAFFFLYWAIDSPVSLIDVMVLVPPVILAVVLPISFGGLGIREAGLALMFAFSGISLEASVTVGLLFYVAELISYSPGIPMFIRGRGK